jgi:predicted ATPase
MLSAGGRGAVGENILSELKLKFGVPGAPPLALPIGSSITVLVGPNNSGKSLLLREIVGFCNTGTSTNFSILDKLVFPAVDEATAIRDLEAIAAPPTFGEANSPEYRKVVGVVSEENIHLPNYYVGRSVPNQQPTLYANTYARHLVRHLDGHSRLSLMNDQGIGDLKRPNGLLARLLTDDSRRARIRGRIHKQLGSYLALDITNLPNISVRMGTTLPPNERSVEDATIAYMRMMPPLASFSDGVRAFCGMMVNIHVGLPSVISVDEPEAFLAPPLVHALGKELAVAAVEEGKQIFAATHSSHFLMGAISAGAPVNIIRLTYTPGGTGTARLLAAADLSTLMNDPLLRSANVLSALFYRGVVVGEADSDRAFYQECNERMLSIDDPRALTDTLFLNANGKDVVPMIVEPLRKLGIPAAAIVDLDVLKKGGEVWTRHLKACGVPQIDRQPFGTRRQNVLRALESADADWKRNGGLGVLVGEAKLAAHSLLEDLARYGMFVVPRGEIEAWLPGLGAPRSKSLWLHNIFEKMGSDPNQRTYERPGVGDVWEFLGGVAAWIRDSGRRGVT